MGVVDQDAQGMRALKDFGRGSALLLRKGACSAMSIPAKSSVRTGRMKPEVG